MADENVLEKIPQQLEEVEKGIKEFKTKASDLEKSVNDKATIAEVKSLSESVLKVEKSFQEYRLGKDEADRKNQEAIDKLQARSQDRLLTGPEVQKSFNELLAEKLYENQERIEKMARKDSGRETQFVIDMNTKVVGDVLIANYTGGTRGLTALRPGIIESPRRKVHVRDLLPTGTIGAGTAFVFMKENGAGEGAIAPVAEGATKPQIDVDLIESSVNVETIAGWLRVTRKAMNNIPGFVSFLQSRLPEKLLLIEDAQLLNGDGISPNIKGILTAGNFTAASGAATIDIEQIIQAIGQLDALGRNPNGIVLAVADYYNILLNKASTSGEYDLPKVVTVDANGVLRILGIPVSNTAALTTGTAVVGDFTGAQLMFQEGIRIEFFEQDGTNVRENKITVRIEETIAFPVYGSDYFIKVTL